jgi:hypothetical protein
LFQEGACGNWKRSQNHEGNIIEGKEY